MQTKKPRPARMPTGAQIRFPHKREGIRFRPSRSVEKAQVMAASSGSLQYSCADPVSSVCGASSRSQTPRTLWHRNPSSFANVSSFVMRAPLNFLRKGPRNKKPRKRVLTGAFLSGEHWLRATGALPNIRKGAYVITKPYSGRPSTRVNVPRPSAAVGATPL